MKDKNIKENTDKQAQQTQNIETEETQQTQTPQDQPAEQETQEDKVESMGVKLAEINEKYLRLYSEFENYRKRTSKEKIELISNASEEMIKDLLPVLDDYQRALDAIDKMENQQDKQTFEGLTLIYKKFYSVLENRGLKPINAIGEVFDENLHDAIAQLPAPKPEDKGKVLDETTKGYYLNDKVIRYSKVVVAI